MKRFIAALLIGIIAGAALMNLYLTRMMDELYISREKIKIDLYETTQRLKKLESQQQQQLLVIREIHVEFANTNGDSLVELEVEAAILELTKDLIGEEVEKVHHALVMHLLDQRLLEVDGNSYRLRVRSMVIAAKTTFVLNYTRVSVDREDEP